MSTLTITIDTNCINTRQGKRGLNRLEELALEGHVEIIKTDVLETELAGWEGSRGKIAREKSTSLKEDIGSAVIGHSRIGHTRIADDEDAALYDEIANAVFGAPLRRLYGRQVRDVMMVATHRRHTRDILVTLDKGLRRKAGQLKERFGVIVMSPDDCVRRAQELASTRSN